MTHTRNHGLLNLVTLFGKTTQRCIDKKDTRTDEEKYNVIYWIAYLKRLGNFCLEHPGHDQCCEQKTTNIDDMLGIHTMTLRANGKVSCTNQRARAGRMHASAMGSTGCAWRTPSAAPSARPAPHSCGACRKCVRHSFKNERAQNDAYPTYPTLFFAILRRIVVGFHVVHIKKYVEPWTWRRRRCRGATGAVLSTTDCDALEEQVQRSYTDGIE